VSKLGYADDRRVALGVTPEIEAAVINYERQLGGAVVTAGIAKRVFHALYQCDGVERARTMTRRDLLSLRNVGRSTVTAMIDLGLCIPAEKRTADLTSALKRKLTSALKRRSSNAPEIDLGVQAFVTSAIEWRLHAHESARERPSKQAMLSSLDALIILLGRE
jgi:hypothetical protein